jgi:hypothetical protein
LLFLVLLETAVRVAEREVVVEQTMLEVELILSKLEAQLYAG